MVDHFLLPDKHNLLPVGTLSNAAVVLQFCSQSILARLLAVALLAVPFVLTFGFAYQRTSGVSLGRSLFKAYAVLQRVPGANACNDEKLPSVWVMNLTHVVRLHAPHLFTAVLSLADLRSPAGKAGTMHGRL